MLPAGRRYYIEAKAHNNTTSTRVEYQQRRVIPDWVNGTGSCTCVDFQDLSSLVDML
jgi:hypothetical protein